MSDIIYIPILFAYLILSYALPIFIIQNKLRKHYRDWISFRAYWRRHYKKIIFRNKVFYTDEITMDVIITAICGFLSGWIGCKILLFRFELLEYVQDGICIAAIITCSIIIFAVTQIERFRIIDDELSTYRKMTGNDFNETEELEKMKRDCNKYILNKQF